MREGDDDRTKHDALDFKHEALGEGLFFVGRRAGCVVFLGEEPADEVEGAFDVEVVYDVVGGGYEDEALKDIEEEVVDDAEHLREGKGQDGLEYVREAA